MHFYYILKIYLLNLKIRVYVERCFPLLVHSPDGHSNLSWVRMKVRAKYSIQGITMIQILELSSAAFPGTFRRKNSGPTTGTSNSLACCAQNKPQQFSYW